MKNGVILTSPQCGGTHALIGMLKGFGLRLSSRHRDGVYYPRGSIKSRKGSTRKADPGTPIGKDFDFQMSHGEFTTGHSGPFPTDLPVICNLRDPRNIMLCDWSRRRSNVPFRRWLTSAGAVQRASSIPRHWAWSGDHVLKVWYEDVGDERWERTIAEFCGVRHKRTNFWGRGKTWSGAPSDWSAKFDAKCVIIWDRLWREITDQSWDRWWAHNGRGAD